ncbi:oligosaccharide flippase family protein [Aeromonas caviae]
MKKYLFLLIKGGSWSLICGALGKFAIAFAYVILARKLESESYGDFSIVQSNIVLFGTFAGLGLGTTAVKLISSSDIVAEKNSILLSILKLFAFSVITVSLLIIVFATQLSYIFYGNKDYVKLFYASVPLLISSSFFSLISAVYISYGSYALNGLNSIIQGFILLLIYYYFEQSDVLYAIYYLALSFFIPLIFFIFWMMRLNVFGNKISYSIKSVMRVCIPIALSTLLVVPTNWLITILLARYSPGQAVEVGLFNAASQWKNIILFVPMTLSPFMLSLLSKNIGEVAVSTKLTINVLISGISATLVFLLIYLFSDDVALAYGESYQGVSSLIILYSAITILIVINNSFGQYLISTGKLTLGFFLNTVWAIVYVSASWFFIEMGALGILYALGISYVLHSVIQFVFVTLEIKKRK